MSEPFASDDSTSDHLDEVVSALHESQVALGGSLPTLPDTPGLYAIHGHDGVWRQLGLGAPPDSRPLYIGKSESSLHAREVSTHFSSGRTGSSTVRRSLAGLLRHELDLRAVPRNRDRPGYFASFSLPERDDRRLTRWMRGHLTVAVWERGQPISLDALETRVLHLLVPPLNISKVRTPWRQQVRDARRGMADQARQWARDRGFDG